VLERTSNTAVYQETYGDGDNHTEEDEEEDRETNSQTCCSGAPVFVAAIEAVFLSVTAVVVVHALAAVTLELAPKAGT
jgi:hypothetical protein